MMAIEDNKESGNPRESGAVSIEAAFAVSGILLFLLVAVDLLRVSYISLAGQYVVERSAHWGAMGSQLPGLNREESIRQTVVDLSRQFGLPVKVAEVRICKLGLEDPLCMNQSAGDPGDSFTLSFIYRTRSVLGGFSVGLNFLAAETNELYAN